MTELIGYLASALVVTSLTMRSILRLRMISLAGSATFLTYGVLIGSPPIIITNVCIAAINVWFLRKEMLLKRGDGRDLGVSLIRADSPFLRDFIEYHADDIARFQPDFATEHTEGPGEPVAMLYTRDGLPAGVLVGRRADDALVIDLDYVLREQRDSRLGAWLYGKGADVFRDAGLSRLRAFAHTESHRSYLERVGFNDLGDSEYELAL